MSKMISRSLWSSIIIQTQPFQLYENNGILKRTSVDEIVKLISKEDRKQFGKLGIKVGRYHIFLPKMLKPKAVSLRILLWKFHNGILKTNEIPKSGLNFLVENTSYASGLKALWDNLTPAEKLPLANFNSPPDFNFVGIFWQDGIAGSIGFLFLNQGLIMRFMAARSVNEGRKAAAFNVLVILPILILHSSGILY